MALDFSILDDLKHPLKTVPLGIQEHLRLFGTLSDAQLPLLSRLVDYYSDTRFSFAELRALSGEIEKCLLEAAPEDQSILEELAKLILEAQRLGKAIDVQAD